MACAANASAYMVKQAQRAIKYTAEQLQTLTKPSFVNNVWRPAELNNRAVRKLRQAALINGEEFPLPMPLTWHDKMEKQKQPKKQKKSITDKIKKLV